MKDFGKRTITGDPVLDTLINYKKSIFLGLIALLVGTSGFFLYRYNKCVSSQAAYAAMNDFLETKKSLAKNENGIEELLSKVEALFLQNKNSGLAPVFLLEKASLLLSGDKTSEAISVMRQALKQMNASILKDLYHIKLCRIMYYFGTEEEAANGLAELEELSFRSEIDPAARKIALYFLHNAFWNEKNVEKAMAFGKKFLSLDLVGAEKDYSFSKFSETVSKNLDLISAE